MERQSTSIPNIRPASDLRTKFTDVMTEIYKSNRPIFLTKKGRCDVVIMSAETFSKLESANEASLSDLSEVKKRKTDNENEARCSFCGKHYDAVKHLIAGPKAYICDECVSLCVEVFKEEHNETP